MTVTGVQAGAGYEYHHRIHVTETAGATATITGVAFSFYRGGSLYATLNYGPEAWNGSNTIAANGTLDSNELVAADSDPTGYIERSEARIAFSDTSSTSRSVTISADVPSLPGPPPNTKFILTGTVKDASSGSTIRDVKIEVRDGANAGRSTKTDRNGKYSLADLKAGSFTVRASKTDYTSSELAVINSAKVLNFTLRKSGGGGGGGGDDDGGGGGGGGSSLTCDGGSVPSVVDCPNNQGRQAPTAQCKDGTYSCSENRSGTCSHHDGVKCWVCPGPLCEGILAAPELSTEDATPEWLLPAGPPKQLEGTVR
jgi:hypothetical protein